MPTPRFTTPRWLKSMRYKLNLSVEQMAAVLSIATGRTLRRWEIGSHDIPPYVDVMLEMLYPRSYLAGYFRDFGVDPNKAMDALRTYLVDRGMHEWARRLHEKEVEAEKGGFEEEVFDPDDAPEDNPSAPVLLVKGRIKP